MGGALSFLLLDRLVVRALSWPQFRTVHYSAPMLSLTANDLDLEELGDFAEQLHLEPNDFTHGGSLKLRMLMSMAKSPGVGIKEVGGETLPDVKVLSLTNRDDARRATLADELYTGWRTPAQVLANHARVAVRANSRLADVTYPFQVYHARADQLVPPASSERLVAAASLAPIRSFKLCGGRHDLHMETEWKTCLEGAHEHFAKVTTLWMINRDREVSSKVRRSARPSSPADDYVDVDAGQSLQRAFRSCLPEISEYSA